MHLAKKEKFWYDLNLRWEIDMESRHEKSVETSVMNTLFSIVVQKILP